MSVGVDTPIVFFLHKDLIIYFDQKLSFHFYFHINHIVKSYTKYLTLFKKNYDDFTNKNVILILLDTFRH